MKKSLCIMAAVMAAVCVLSCGYAAEAVSIVSSFDDGYIGREYSSSVYVTGGEEPYDWDLVSGSLPDGLEGFPEGDGDDTMVIEGTPTKTGRYTFTLEVKDAEGETARKSFTITIGEIGGENGRNSFNGGDSSSSGGCDAGTAGLGLLFIAGLAFRKLRRA
ncbi:MAG: hypothetical protein IJS28_00950 [Synergistaceae bacterium]|nr:hypothetical protein [Synergistaceae bacterium]